MSTPTPFVNLAGWQIYNPPFHLDQTRCFGYWVKGDRQRLQSSLDAYLNAGLPDNIYYCALTGQVLAAVVDIGHLSCVNPPQCDEGWLEEVDFAFFALVVRLEKCGPLWLPRKLALAPLFLFVDNPLAVMGGREVFGYPKSQGKIQLPSPDGEMPLAITTYTLPTFTKQTQLKLEQIITIQADAPPAPPSTVWQSADEWLHALINHAVEGVAEVMLPEVETVVKWAEHLSSSQVSFVFRKQFPDATNPLNACYSALIEAPLQVTAFRGGGIIAGPHTLNIANCASLQIAQFFGLPCEPIRVELAFHTDADFLVELGTVVHQIT